LGPNNKSVSNETSLLTELASVQSLNHAWNQLNKENEDSYGWSRTTIKDFGQNLEYNLNKISKDLIAKKFRFSPTRAAVRKKDNGGYRPLQIPEIKDRVVLKAIAILLEEQLAGILSKSEGVSFAYQQGKGVREAVLKMKSNYQSGGTLILKADIVNFFEEVKKDKLLRTLIYPNLKDESINKLIEESLSHKLRKGKWIDRKHKELFKNAGKGIPQGNPLSPLLSNIYLSSFDVQLKEAGYSLIRYADDFIVMFHSKEDAVAGYEKIVTILRDEFSLLIHPLGGKNSKTTITDPTEDEFSFLSIKFDGKKIYPGRKTVDYLKDMIGQLIKEGSTDSPLFKPIYQAIEKWISKYSYLDIERYFDEIDDFLKAELKEKFEKKYYWIKKCRGLAHRVRTRQHAKGTTSFWRNPSLAKLLPEFMRPKILTSSGTPART